MMLLGGAQPHLAPPWLRAWLDDANAVANQFSPSLNISVYGDFDDTLHFGATKYKNSTYFIDLRKKQAMPRTCFVPGCRTSGYKRKKIDKKNPEHRYALFSVPKDPVLRKKWHIASRRADREMTERDVMCELHFTEDCLVRHFTTEVFDGTIFKLERDRPLLIKGSVPTIFPFSKSNSDSKRGKRKKLCSDQNKQGENGSNDFDLRKKLSPSKLSQVTVCSAYGCTNSSDKKVPGISFHRFPTDKIQKAWMSVFNQEEWMPSSESYICSAHFTPNQIEGTGSSARLKIHELPTIFPSGEKNRRSKLPKNLTTDVYDSSDSDRNESHSSEICDWAVQHSDDDDDEVPLTETDGFAVKKENDEIPEEISSDVDIPSTSKNLIAEGHENIFGKFVASELKILSCDPPLYLRTKEKIWQVLEQASRMRVQ